MTRRTIGRAARAAGVNVEAVRFYERRGLIAQLPKPAGGGARDCDDGTIARIRFIRQAQDIGFTLREAAELLSLRADPRADCGDVRIRAIGKRDEVEAKMAQLARLRGALDRLIVACPGGGELAACSILEATTQAPTRASPAATTPNAEGETMKTTELTLDGMHCHGCARTVEAVVGIA